MLQAFLLQGLGLRDGSAKFSVSSSISTAGFWSAILTDEVTGDPSP